MLYLERKSYGKLVNLNITPGVESRGALFFLFLFYQACDGFFLYLFDTLFFFLFSVKIKRFWGYSVKFQPVL